MKNFPFTSIVAKFDYCTPHVLLRVNYILMYMNAFIKQLQHVMNSYTGHSSPSKLPTKFLHLYSYLGGGLSCMVN